MKRRKMELKRIIFSLLFFVVIVSLGFSQQFNFVVFGDNRPFNNEDPQPQIFKEIVQNVEWIHPDFVVDVGDLIYGYGADAQRTRQEYMDFLNVVKIFSMPFYTVVGNHDVAGIGGQKYYETLLKKPLYYSFDYEKSHFILLDTNVNFPNGKFTQKQYNWLVKDLNSATSAQNIFFFMHKPLHEYQDYSQNAWADKFMAKKVDDLITHFNSKHHNIRMVFQGHEHLYWRTEFNGIIYMITGGTGASLAEEPQNGGFYHFVLVTVNGTHVKTNVLLPGYFSVKYLNSNSGTSDKVMVVVENHLPSVYEGLSVKGLKFVMPEASFYKVSGNIPCKIWKITRNSDGTADVWVEANLDFNSLSVKSVFKAALSALILHKIPNISSFENISRLTQDIITVSVSH